ncbi:hypothetical protein [Corynebacterium sp. TAE3-ERU30]|uniref:hypothetical protein n=1 Tax=Corynebacterium sp. TAE3-ERU30 TaxID=2849496 RepID=UPI001C4497B0|nr:hypothetical protein [Corynebacterium sp. TAE3-ERU30]MBV7281134.1 hypothetical protein [Corynebacterium sp. TAE3-ERU30]
MSAPESRHPASVATLSLAVAVTIALSALGTNFTHQSLWYSGLAAVTMVVCSGAIGLLAIRRFVYQHVPIRWPHLLCGAGAVVSLISGCATLVVRQLGSPTIHSTVTLASFYAMPVAAVACALGGFLLLPRRCVPAVFGIISGALATGYISLGEDTLLTRSGVVATAVATLVLSVWSIVDLRGYRSRGAWPLRLAAAIIAAVMTYAIVIAATPSSWWASYAPPQALALSYIAAAALGLSGGLSYHGPQQRPHDAA